MSKEHISTHQLTKISVQQPPGYEFTGESGTRLTCHLKKSLYGLKKSGRNWHNTLTDFLKSKGFTVSDTDPYVYTLQTPPNEQIIASFGSTTSS